MKLWCNTASCFPDKYKVIAITKAKFPLKISKIEKKLFLSVTNIGLLRCNTHIPINFVYVFTPPAALAPSFVRSSSPWRICVFSTFYVFFSLYSKTTFKCISKYHYVNWIHPYLVFVVLVEHLIYLKAVLYSSKSWVNLWYMRERRTYICCIIKIGNKNLKK